MSRPRDTYRYVLRDGRDVVGYGVTNDPEARENAHAGKRITSMTVVGSAVTRESALAWERTQSIAVREGPAIETYRTNFFES